jgi:hypothetical protein
MNNFAALDNNSISPPFSHPILYLASLQIGDADQRLFCGSAELICLVLEKKESYNT